MAVVAMAPLAILAWRNPRALPAGLFGIALLFLLTAGLFGFALGTRQTKIELAIIAVVLAAGFAAGTWFSSADPASRPRWTALSCGAWMIALLAGRMFYQEMRSEKRYQEQVAGDSSAAAATQRSRAALAADPTLRAATLNEQIKLYADSLQERFGDPRFIWLGDPVAHPESVTVWAIYDLSKGQRHDGIRFHLWYAFGMINKQLKDAGYPARIAVGAANAADVQAAGGDTAYFGAHGEKWIPQLSPANVTQDDVNAGRPPLFGWPVRRDSR